MASQVSLAGSAMERTDSRLASCAPSPLVGEGWGGGSTRAVFAATPTPAPSERASLVSPPQGGGELVPQVGGKLGDRLETEYDRPSTRHFVTAGCPSGS